MANKSELRKEFLDKLEGKDILVSLFLVNGIKLQGKVVASNEEVILLENNSITQMVFKHAISTVVPSKAIEGITSEKK